MKNLSEYRFAIFDSDGVVLDSNSVKTEAFRTALIGEPEGLVEQFIAYHKENGGISRYVKFRYYYEVIKGTVAAEALIEKSLERYGRAASEGLLSCPEIAGIRALLGRLRSYGIPCFVNTGGDQVETRLVYKSRGLDVYFVGIYGSPPTKRDNVARILSETGCSGAAGVYLGDAYSDWVAASEVRMDFVFLSGVSEWHDGGRYAQLHSFDSFRDATGLLR